MQNTDPQTIDLHTRLSENNVRIGKMFPFPGGAGFQEVLEDLDDDQLPAEIAALLAKWSEEERDQLHSGGVDSHMAFEELCGEGFRRGVYGWFGEVHTPVVKPFGSGNAVSYSWGHYHMGYLFAPTAEAFLEKAIAWAEERETADRKEPAA